MILSSEFFPFKRPPRTFIRDFNLIITNLSSCVFCTIIFVLIHNHKTNALSLVKSNTRFNENNYSLGTNNNKIFVNNVSETDDSKLYQPWKYVYSNKSTNKINDSMKHDHLNNVHTFLVGKNNTSDDVSLPENVAKILTTKNIFDANASTNSSAFVEDKTKTGGKKAYFFRGADAVNCSVENEKLCNDLQKNFEKSNTVITENSKDEIQGNTGGQESRQSLTTSKELFPVLQSNFSYTDKKCRNLTDSQTLLNKTNNEDTIIRNNNKFTTGVKEISSETPPKEFDNLLEKFNNDKFVNVERYSSGDESTFDNAGLQSVTEDSILVFTKIDIDVIPTTEESFRTNLAKTSKERKLSLTKVKRRNSPPREITNLKDDEGNFSDDDNYGIRSSGIKSDKSVSTLLSPLDITPLLKKNKNKELDKKREKENKSFNRQAHESEGLKYTTQAKVHLPISRVPSTQLVIETSVTTIQVPRSTRASNIVSGASVNQPKTSEHLHGSREDEYGTGPTVEVLTRTNEIKSTENFSAVSGRDLVTDIPQHNQLDSPSGRLSPNRSLITENIHSKHSNNLTDCDKNQSALRSGCNHSVITSHNVESNKTLSSLNSLFKLDNQSESNNANKFTVPIKSANTSNVPDVLLITVATSASVIVNNQSNSENSSSPEDTYNSVSSDPYQYSTEPNNLDTQTNFQSNTTYEASTESFLFTYKSSDNTSTQTEINPPLTIYTTLIQTEFEAPIIESVPHVKVIVNETMGWFGNVSEPEENVKLNEHTSSSPFTLVSNYTLTTLPSVTHEPLQPIEGSTSLIKSDDQWLNQLFNISSQPNATNANSSVSNASNNSTEDASNIWPVKLASVVEGDIILGGLMMVSESLFYFYSKCYVFLCFILAK